MTQAFFRNSAILLFIILAGGLISSRGTVSAAADQGQVLNRPDQEQGLSQEDEQDRTLRSDETGPFMGAQVGDLDGDGLDSQEEAAAGTDPQNEDSDGDGLLDGWEVKGVNGMDLKALGAKPRRKDIFVEMDFMTRTSATNGLAPSAHVIQRIVDAFAQSSARNVDGSTGISIHLELGNEVPLDSDLNPYITEFVAIRRANFSSNRAPVFHYMVWADGHSGGTSSGVSLDIPASDFIVTLGRWNGNKGGTDDQKVGTFIHELGHNLGLKHGGSDHVGFKPNHLSVMNYLFQTQGLIINGSGGHYSYQGFALGRLQEAALREATGLGGLPVLANRSTMFSLSTGGRKTVPCHASIDWNNDNDDRDSNLRLDINGDGDIAVLEATPDEWGSLFYIGGSIGSTAPLQGLGFANEQSFRPLPEPELTEEMNSQIVARQ